MCKCQKCGFTWEARIDNPRCCPNCKSRLWKGKKIQQTYTIQKSIKDRMLAYIIQFGDIGIKRSEFASRYYGQAGSEWSQWLDELEASGEIRSKIVQGTDCNGRATRKTQRYFYRLYFID